MFQSEFQKWRTETNLRQQLAIIDEKMAFGAFFDMRREDSEDIIEELGWQVYLIQKSLDSLEDI